MGLRWKGAGADGKGKEVRGLKRKERRSEDMGDKGLMELAFCEDTCQI